MIYTLTLNPALDYVMHTNGVQAGAVNRSREEMIFFGGKGINVSFVLKELGLASTALGFIGGFTGDALEKEVASRGVKADFCHLPNSLTRINVKLIGDSVTEINGAGPVITESDMEKLSEKLDGFKEGDTLVLAGSIPQGLAKNTYAAILSRLEGRGVKAVVDTSGEALVEALKHRPYLVKPNLDELSEIAGTALSSEEDVIRYAKKLKEAGAVNVLVSLGADGAILVDEFGKVHSRRAFEGEQINSVGAGDSALAGFLAGAENGYAHALLLACAAGAATAFSEGLAKADEIKRLAHTEDA